MPNKFIVAATISNTDKEELIRERQIIEAEGYATTNLYIDCEYESPRYGLVKVWAFKVRGA